MSGHHSWILYCDYPLCQELIVGSIGDNMGKTRQMARDGLGGWVSGASL